MPQARPRRRRKPLKWGKSFKNFPKPQAHDLAAAVVQQDASVPVAPPSNGVSEPAQSSPAIQKPEVTSYKHLPDDSIVRDKAMHILSMRMAGFTNPEIAKAVELSERSVRQYLYLAGKNGWLADKSFADPKDKIEFGTLHKVVRNLDEMLDDTNLERRDGATLHLAKGVLYKKFENEGAQTQAPPALMVKIEFADGAPKEPPAVLVGGVPRFIEGEVVKRDE